MFDDVMPATPGWENFPVTAIDPDFDPFRQPLLGGSATTAKLFLLALQASGAQDSAGLRERLSEVDRLAADGISAARTEGIPAAVGCLPVTPQYQPGLAFILLNRDDIGGRFPAHELYASLALWILWESHRLMSIDPIRGLAMEVQASLCVLFSAGEGGYVVGHASGVEQQRKWLSEKNRVGANASHREQNRRWALLLAEYDQGLWSSKTAAAELLAKKYSFETETVRKRLYKERKNATNV